MTFINYFIFSHFCFFLIGFGSAEVIDLNGSNLDSVLRDHELVLVNFYADWCRFSQMLSPIFEEAAKAVKNKFPEAGKVAFAKVDCDREVNIAQGYQVSKYPTLKVFRMSQMMKKEYRGQRSVDAFVSYIADQLQDPITKAQSHEDLDNLEYHHRYIIGYYDSEDSGDYAIFRKAAAVLKNDCSFYTLSGPQSERDRVAGNKIVYRPASEDANEMVYAGLASDEAMVLKWATDKCIPIVRSITFENAEELTEENLPFLLLFHHPDDTESPERFRKFVSAELLSERNNINFLVADGIKFAHPLHHLGKSASDLPLIAIDSFKHMYVWPHDFKTHLEKPGALLQFIQDLRSGKLHREFHNGPDPVAIEPVKEDPVSTEAPTHVPFDDASTQNAPIRDDPSKDTKHIPRDNEEDEITQKPTTKATSPPKSQFKNLAPSRSRYTILKDEL